MIWAARIGLIVGWIFILRWIVVYTRLQPWWKDPVGVALVVEAGGVAALFLVLTLDEFFRLDHQWASVMAWVGTVIVCSVGPVHEWRTQVWKRIARQEAQGRHSLAVTSPRRGRWWPFDRSEPAGSGAVEGGHESLGGCNQGSSGGSAPGEGEGTG